MTFLHPLILGVGLGAVALPVLIHLLRRRRRPIPWAAMRFLQEAMRKRRRRLRIEQLLLLLTRCALVALLGLAVARPVLGTGPGSARPTTLVLAVDDSIASAQTDGAGRSALARAVERAKKALDALNPAAGDTVGVVTLASPPQALIWPPTADTDTARRALDRLQAGDSAPSLNALRTALGEPASDEDRPRVVVRVLSDWRAVDPQRLFAGAPLAGVDRADVDPPATDGARANVGIRSLTPSTPTVLGDTALAPPTQAGVTLVRSDTTDERLVEIEALALPGGTIAGRAQARFAPGQDTAQATIQIDDAALTPGRGGRVAIEAHLPDDANPRDNAARCVLTVRRELRVGVVERPPAGGSGVAPGVWTLAALAPDARAGIDAFRVDPASLASLPPASVDALILLEPARLSPDAWARARELLARGGLVVIAPDADRTPAGWGPTLGELTGGALTLGAGGGSEETDAGLDNTDAPAGVLSGLGGEFRDLARGVGVRRLVPVFTNDDATVVLRTDRGAVYLAQSPGAEGRGVCVVFASALDLTWTDLPARPAFVPVLQEIVRRASGLGVDTGVTAGRTPAEDASVDRWTHDNDLSNAPEPPGTPGSRAGVLLGVARDGSVVRTLAINPDAEAARTTPAPAEALRSAVESAFPGASVAIERTDAGVDAAPPKARATPAGDRVALLMLALAAALSVFEALLARRASHPEGVPA